MNIFNKKKVKNQVNISGNGTIVGNNINVKNSSIVSNCSNVIMVSTNTENYVIVNEKRYDAPVGASINVINNMVYVNNKKIN
jgi:hypothetical protein